MESTIKSESIKTYFPTSNDLKNFKNYIKTIAKDGSCVAKVSDYLVFSINDKIYYLSFSRLLFLLLTKFHICLEINQTKKKSALSFFIYFMRNTHSISSLVYHRIFCVNNFVFYHCHFSQRFQFR